MGDGIPSLGGANQVRLSRRRALKLGRHCGTVSVPGAFRPLSGSGWHLCAYLIGSRRGNPGDQSAAGRLREQLAKQRGWKVVEWYVDSDISAYSGKRRPEYQRMLEEIEAGILEAVVVYHADRLHRHPRKRRIATSV